MLGEDVRFFHSNKKGVDRVFVDHPSFLSKVLHLPNLVFGALWGWVLSRIRVRQDESSHSRAQLEPRDKRKPTIAPLRPRSSSPTVSRPP